ncbi:ATP12 family chaperone protein [Sphingobium sp.]|uniref:ATP12 family chaperone protein n=1 Tax=Sphingobium sp. TaxID=1912891 RepID=UPI003BB70242
MKRFYTDVAIVPAGDAFAIQLDGRPVRTPARALLALPTEALAEAVAQEWSAQGQTVEPGTMPVTGLANAAIDHIAIHHVAFGEEVARYAQSDLLCYRAEAPATLVARQAFAWDPLLDWAQAHYDVLFVVTQGILPVPQPEEMLLRLRNAVLAQDPFTLAGLSTLVTISGSLVCGLAIVEGGHDPDAIWHAADIDDAWQVERWGEDAEAAARTARRRADFAMAGDFCRMSRP